MENNRVLFLCIGNTARSQMAEAFLRKHAGEHFAVYSAGLSPSIINPYTERVMREIGMDLSGHFSKSVKEYLGKLSFTYLITVCGDPNVSTADPIVHSFKNTCQFTGLNFLGVVQASASTKGEVAKNEEVKRKAYDLGKISVTK